ncbi:acyl-CoA thioesterase (plasmid) [Mycolicibacterium arabiense]|uniref:Acyl-CoA thioesterase n=1 Tax=Mycolicibacterium arabiense TaxID=1286181 RepID=A0A7I7RQ69_9MYCO|nr:thioesterase family protein [Mycolicibacterium arabiense]MCV7372002.1 thioesterase family protein [Mycolicibacterium arabiense]BBY46677.1 acyl-CoA thioesterase [Mycolicibacterium arabiense]
MHPFDTATELEPIAAGLVRGHTEPQWANMVGPFGGITAATILRALEVQPERVGEPVALTVNFAAPIGDGEFEIVTEPARSNRSNQHWIARLRQVGETKTTATALFGTRRDSWSDTEAEAPVAPTPEQTGPQKPSEFAPWLRNYDMRIVDGAAPADASQARAESTTTLWVRDDPARTLDHAALTGLCDVFFPRVFLRRGGFVPAGTISLTIYFHADHRQLRIVGEDFVLGRARANHFGGGYFDQSATMWSRGGALLATTHQIVYFKG